MRTMQRAALLTVALGVAQAAYTIDVVARYGAVTFDTLTRAHRDGVAALGHHPEVTLKLPAGRFVLDMTGTLFDVSGVKAQGEYSVQGAGMDKTILLLDQKVHEVIAGTHFRNVAWRDMTFSHTRGQTTQGAVVNVTASTVTLHVPAGFPTPRDILEYRAPRLRPSQGLYMLQYSTAAPGSAARPVKRTEHAGAMNRTVHALPVYNHHLGYKCSASKSPAVVNRSAYDCELVEDLGDGRWRFHVQQKDWQTLHDLYEAAIGDDAVIVGIKAKRLSNAFALKNGAGATFERVSWQGHSRGVVQDSHNVAFLETDVSPMPPPQNGGGAAYAVATNGGGPQLHACTGIRVIGHLSQSSGDDSLAFFSYAPGDLSGTVTNNTVLDGWGANMLLNGYDPAALRVYGNTMLRSPICVVPRP